MPAAALRARGSQSLTHQVLAVLPPVKGINSTGSVASMQPTDALEMDNLISTDLGIVVRGGWFEYATGIGKGAPGSAAPQPIRTLTSYNGSPVSAAISPLSNSELFAACDNGIYSVEGGGNLSALAPDIALSGTSNAGRLSSVMFSNDAGQWLVACSEVDGAFIYNGTAWHKMVKVTTAPANPWEMQNADPTLLVQCFVFKKRVGYVERNSGRVWFSAINSVSGAMTPFNFGPLLQHGGSVLACMNWTQDDGQGTDDRLVILGTSGDLIVYEGNDPTDATQFRNSGVWYVGPPPIGRRCFTTSGGSPLVLTVFGVIPVSQVVQGGLDNVLTAGTDYLQQLRKLQNILNTDFETLHDTLGWEALTVPDSALMMIARPAQAVGEFVQYTFQQHNLAWNRLLDMPAVTFHCRLNELYGGGDDGRVLRLLAGTVDGVKLDGTGAFEIRARLTPSFNDFGAPTVHKQALMMRINWLASVHPGYRVRMNVNYWVPLYGIGPVPVTAAPGSLWDASLWGAGFWSGGLVSQGEWIGVEGLGYALAPTIFIGTTESTTMASIEYMVKAGGPL